MADQSASEDVSAAEQAASQETSNNYAALSSTSEAGNLLERKRSLSREQAEEPAQESLVQIDQGGKSASRRASREAKGIAAETEKDDSVVTGAGSTEEVPESTLSPEALEASLPAGADQADTAAESNETSTSNGEAALVLDAPNASEAKAESGQESSEPSAAQEADEAVTAQEGDSQAEPRDEPRLSSKRESRSQSQTMGGEASSDEGQTDANAVAKELNSLLGNPDADAGPVLTSADVLGSSGQIGAEIEGFHDDFLVAQAPPPPEELPEPEPEASANEEEEMLAARLQEAREERARLVAENQQLQRRCAAIMGTKRSADRSNEGGLLDDEMRYSSSLHQWVAQGEELRRVSAYFDAAIERSKDELQARQDSAVQIRSNYLQLEMEVAREAENSRTGRPLPTKTLRQLEETGRRKDEELETVRLKSIILKNTLGSLERTLKRREELADGLHQVDFEQLKIENQSLSEKIKVRDEELAKLRKKVNTTVHILTHQKEKLQHIHRDTEAEGRLLEGIEKEVAEKREKVQRLKRQRDAVKGENKNLKLASGAVTQPELLADIAVQKEVAETLKEKVHGLQQRHAALSASLTRAGGLSGMSTPLGVATNGDTGSAKSPLRTAKSPPGSARSPLSGRLLATSKDGTGRLAAGSTEHTPLSTNRSLTTAENMMPRVAITSASLRATRSP